MHTARWHRVNDIVKAALALDTSSRGAFLTEQCGNDGQLLQEAEKLLAEIALNKSFLEKPIFQPEQNDVPLPKEIDGYRIIREVARGGMGIVFEASQQDLGRNVALKIIQSHPVFQQGERRLKREAKILSRLDHAGIANIIEFGRIEFGGCFHPYFAMEFIDGTPLGEYAESLKDKTSVLNLFVKVCDAVHYAHSMSVIHRDLKPSNILVTSEGQPKVIDFGIAQVTSKELGLTTLHTRPGTLLGSIRYMSPEQAAGRTTDLNQTTDVYSLGVILYELLSGHHPQRLDHQPPHVASRMIIEDDPIPLHVHDCSVPNDIKTILEKALQKEATNRYSSVGEMSADIQCYLRHEPIRARPACWRERMFKLCRRNKGPVAGTSVIILVLVAGLLTNWIIYQRELAQRRSAEQRFAIALEIADEHLGLLDELRSIDGYRANQREYLDAAVRHFTRLVEDHPDDLESQRGIWTRLQRLADALREAGDLQNARRVTENFLSMTKSAVKRAPNEILYQSDFSLAYERMGDLENRAGAFALAGEYYRKSLTALEMIDGISHRRRNARLAILHERLTDVALHMNDLDAARRHSAKHIKIIESMVEEEPENLRFLASLQWAYARLGNLAMAENQANVAQTRFHQSLEIVTRLTKLDPKNPRHHQNLARNQQWLAAWCFKHGQHAEGREWLIKEFSTRRNLADHSRVTASQLNEYAGLLMASPESDLRDVRLALEIAERSVALSERRNPYILDTLAHALHFNGRLSEAISTQQQAFALIPESDVDARQAIKSFLDQLHEEAQRRPVATTDELN